MFRRPKPGETEEDLLAFQQQFLAEKSAPSATVVTSKPGDKRKTDESLPIESSHPRKDVVKLEGPLQAKSNDPSPPVKKSRFRGAREKKVRESSMPSYIEDSNDIIDGNDTHMATVLTKIIERDTRRAQFSAPAPMSLPFPSVQPVGDIPKEAPSGQKKKKSLFAQQFEKAPESFGVVKIEGEQLNHPLAQKWSQDKPDSTVPRVIDGSGLSATFGETEARKIHEENTSHLSQMSSDDILSEQQKLLETIDPKLIEFLRSRKVKKEDNQESPSSNKAAQSVKIAERKKTSKEEKTDEALPVDVKKEWVNMDKIEYEKLDWMKDLPPPSADDSKTGKQARFDFKGNLVLDDSNIPVNVGLHHHGDEPERAGYSLEELFSLARSSNNQQRCLALQTLGRVIQQAKEGNLTQLIQTPILPSILDAGVVFLLRWSLDDSVDSVVIATIAALNCLLVNHADELVLDNTFHWHQGHRSVCQAPAEPDVPGIKLPDIQDEKPEDNDADVVKKDVVAALVDRMNFLPRLMYILNKVRPQAPSVIAILQILTRVARHSSRLAYQVYNYKGLLDFIVKEFLPMSWTLEDPSQPLSTVYGLPLVAAMRLLRTLCQAGRNMAAAVLSRYRLEERLMRFLLTVDIQCLHLPEAEALLLQTECWNIWKILLCYGLADKLFLELYPSLVEQLRTSQGVWVESALYQKRLAAMLGAVEMAVCVATGHQQRAGFKHSQDGESMEVERSENVALPTLQWSHVADLIQPIKLLLTSLLSDIAANYQIKKQSLQLPVACLNFVKTFYNRCQTEVSGTDMIKLLEEMEEIFRELTAHWRSYGFITIKGALCKHSNLLCSGELKNVEVSPSLPEYGSSSVGEGFLPVVGADSPYGFMVSLLGLVYHFVKIHKGLLPKEMGVSALVSTIVQDPDIWTYLKKVGPGRPSHLAANWTTRFETHLQYYLLKLATIPVLETDVLTMDRSVLHCVCLQLVTLLQSGDEHLVHDLLSTVLFSPVFWKMSSEENAVKKLESLNLTEVSETYLRSATAEEIRFTQEQLCDEVTRNMASIRATYLTSLASSEKQTLASRNHYLQNAMATESCFTSNIGECLLPSDWMFMPLIELYSQFSVVASESQNLFSTSQINNIRNVLRWIYILELQRPLLLDSVSITLKLSRIMCTFLTGNDIFLDRTVYCYLAGLLRHYMQPLLLAKMNFDETVPGLPSFYDLYMNLLQQYEAVSFGDPVFGSYLCIPLQQRHDFHYRRAIWIEYSGILRTLSLSVSQLLLPIQGFLEPEENIVELLRKYYQALYNGTLRHCWCPVMYLVAIHHVNRFMYTQDGSHKQLKSTMMKQMLLCKNQELKQHLLYYKREDIREKLGMELYTELPAIRQKYVDSFTEPQDVTC